LNLADVGSVCSVCVELDVGHGELTAVHGLAAQRARLGELEKGGRQSGLRLEEMLHAARVVGQHVDAAFSAGRPQLALLQAPLGMLAEQQAGVVAALENRGERGSEGTTARKHAVELARGLGKTALALANTRFAQRNNRISLLKHTITKQKNKREESSCLQRGARTCRVF
jgi:hypothetical protein